MINLIPYVAPEQWHQLCTNRVQKYHMLHLYSGTSCITIGSRNTLCFTLIVTPAAYQWGKKYHMLHLYSGTSCIPMGSRNTICCTCIVAPAAYQWSPEIPYVAPIQRHQLHNNRVKKYPLFHLNSDTSCVPMESRNTICCTCIVAPAA